VYNGLQLSILTTASLCLFVFVFCFFKYPSIFFCNINVFFNIFEKKLHNFFSFQIKHCKLQCHLNIRIFSVLDFSVLICPLLLPNALVMNIYIYKLFFADSHAFVYESIVMTLKYHVVHVYVMFIVFFQ